MLCIVGASLAVLMPLSAKSRICGLAIPAVFFANTVRVTELMVEPPGSPAPGKLKVCAASWVDELINVVSPSLEATALTLVPVLAVHESEVPTPVASGTLTVAACVRLGGKFTAPLTKTAISAKEKTVFMDESLLAFFEAFCVL